MMCECCGNAANGIFNGDYICFSCREPAVSEEGTDESSAITKEKNQ